LNVVENGNEFVFDIERPLGQQPGESRLANSALQDRAEFLLKLGWSLRDLLDDYRKWGQTEIKAGSIQNDDSIVLPSQRLSKPPTRRLAMLLSWSSKYQWEIRLDAYVQQLRSSKREEVARWFEGHMERERELSEKFLSQAKQGLAEVPYFRQTTRRTLASGETLILQGLKGNVISKFAETGSKLGRLAAGMATEHHEFSGSFQFEQVNNFADLSDEQLDQLIDNLAATG
jgi:hypothetical protein